MRKTGILTACSCMLMAAAACSADIEKGLVVYSDFENRAEDLSGNGRDGKMLGAIRDTDAAVGSGSVYFNGTGAYVEYPEGVYFNGDYSISIWVKWDECELWDRILDFNQDEPKSGNAVTWLIGRPAEGTENNLWLDQWVMHEGKAVESILDQRAMPADADTGYRVKLGQWNHYVIVYDSSEKNPYVVQVNTMGENVPLEGVVRLYVDGRLAGTNTHCLKPQDVATVANWLGRSRFAPDPYFHGWMDDFRIYDRCLSQKEIDALYALGNDTQMETSVIRPGIQAPYAEIGARGFGMPRTNSDRNRQRTRPVVEFGVRDITELAMSDPYVLPDEATGLYYMTSSGGKIYTSPDLKTWTGPYEPYDVTGTWMENSASVAAAEMHHIGDKYYYIATFSDRDNIVDYVPRRYNVHHQQSQILVSDTALGPYKPLNKDPEFDYNPRNWAILDGTLYTENGTTYMVFVHEWLQIIDGTMECVPLSEDLTHPVAEPKTLFRATEAPWPKEMNGNDEATYGMRIPGWVTDGPQLFRTGTGRLGMIWASWGAKRYAEGVAYSESGTIDGPWIHNEKPIKEDNSGHAMLFKTFDGQDMMAIHHDYGDGVRRPQIWHVDLSGDELVLGGRYL